MSCTDCNSNEIKYIGNGTQIVYTFPFKYVVESDVYVEFYDEDTRLWVKKVDWSFKSATEIQFNTAPPTDQQFKIARCTDIDPLNATFYPGSAIRAKDLNDNFEQLQFAIQEGRCQVPDWLFDYLNKEYWDKFDDTTYKDDDWDAEADDEHVPTTGAVDDHLKENYLNKGKVVTLEDQKLGRWTSTSNLNSDDNVPSTAATSERHDAFWQDEIPVNVPAYRTPGRRWIDTDDVVQKVWDQQNQTWLDITEAGPQGPKGDTGTYATIVSDNPPTKRIDNTELQNGDIWFNTKLGEGFIWYNDGDSTQWVSLSVPGPAGPQGPPGAGGTNNTFINPLEEDTNNNVSFNINSLTQLN